MTSLSLLEAAEQAGTSKVDIWRAIEEGTLPAQRTHNGFAIDLGDLFRVFEPRPPENHTTGQRATILSKASEQPETAATAKPTGPDGMAVELGGPGTELKGVGLPVVAGTGSEGLHADSAERQAVNVPDRSAQLEAKLAAESAQAINARAAYAVVTQERANLWWRRLVEWFRTRRGRARRMRLRERL